LVTIRARLNEININAQLAVRIFAVCDLQKIYLLGTIINLIDNTIVSYTHTISRGSTTTKFLDARWAGIVAKLSNFLNDMAMKDFGKTTQLLLYAFGSTNKIAH